MISKDLLLEELDQVIGSGIIKEKTISIVRDYWFKSLAIITAGIWIYGGLMWCCIIATNSL